MPYCLQCGQRLAEDLPRCPHCGAPAANDAGAESASSDADLLADVRRLMAAGEKIEAIKVYRSATGASLAAAKAAVEALERGESVSHPGVRPPADDAYQQLAREGRTIEAIKAYREATGAGLKESKAAVDAFLRSEGLAGANRPGCGLLLLIGVLLPLGWRAVL